MIPFGKIFSHSYFVCVQHFNLSVQPKLQLYFSLWEMFSHADQGQKCENARGNVMLTVTVFVHFTHVYAVNKQAL